MKCCYIVGVHDNGVIAPEVALGGKFCNRWESPWDEQSPRAERGESRDRAAMLWARCDLVIGAPHQLRAVDSLLREQAERRDSTGRLGAVASWVEQALADQLTVVVLATGDPLCFGIAGALIDKLGRERVVVLPHLSSLQLAAARLGLPWQDAKLVSVHAADAGEWAPGARHDHGLAPLARALTRHDKLLCLTSPANDPARIARLLLAAGLAQYFRIDVAARLASPNEAVFAELSPADVAVREFPQPNVVALRRVVPRRVRPAFGVEDHEYVQRQPRGDQNGGLLTKFEVRAVSLAKLRLKPDALLWDIGAGAGTVGLEAAQLCPDGHCYAIEKNPADAANARENARRFGVFNYTLVDGKAPAGLAAWPDPDAVFIGGSGGELAGLIALCLDRLKPGGRLVMNFVTFENLATATTALKAAGVVWEIIQMSAARSQPILDLHRLAAQNPVWIVVATKEAP
ncbi:MAG TPA: precorrin-6y C5,15-methyltransferase (decarboxylating) subunit CbiE [Rhodocyclaceae bacterium]|nr:precorrin-6y C5,15-methyltransferase (decarboxylating) subunit CbiE [Rhodocyclaceae bacterium]